MMRNLARAILLITAGLCALFLTWFGLFAKAWGGSGGDHMFVLFWLPSVFALPAFFLRLFWLRLPISIFWLMVFVQFSYGVWLNWTDCVRGNCVPTTPVQLALSGFAFPQVWGWFVLAACLQLAKRHEIPLRHILSIVLIASLFAASKADAAPVAGYRVVATYPHSTQSYTEGFFYRDGLFYEGTGLNGRSQLLVVQPETGKPVQKIDLPKQYFGEGIVDWGPNLYEWTWQSHVCFVYDRFSLRPIRQFTYTGEGWGMTRTAKEIITSDGTAMLRFRNPATFQETRHIVVRDGTKLIDQLNELEYVKGEIYANVWHSDRIARISPQDGHVIGWIDLTGLLSEDQKIDNESVLNGIAYDEQHDRLFVTGKRWPTIFEIKIIKL